MLSQYAEHESLSHQPYDSLSHLSPHPSTPKRTNPCVRSELSTSKALKVETCFCNSHVYYAIAPCILGW